MADESGVLNEESEIEAATEEPEVETAADEPEEAEEKSELEELKEVVNVQTEDIGTYRKKLTVTVPRSHIDKRMGKEFSDLSKDALVPGFRKGRAPLALIQKRFGHDVSDQLIAQILGNSFMAAAEKVELKTIGDPLIWVDVPDNKKALERKLQPGHRLVHVSDAFEFMALPSTGDFVYECEAEIRPDVQLPDLQNIPVRRPKVAVAEADVDRAINRNRVGHGEFKPMTDSNVQENDLVIADMRLTIDDKPIKEEYNVSVYARPQLVEGVLLADLGEKFVGACNGASITLSGQYPEDYDNTDLRGKTATFTFTINEIKRYVLPPLDREYLEKIGFDSEDELRRYVRRQLEAKLDGVLEQAMREQVQKYLLDNVTLELPDELSRKQTERIIARYQVELYRQGHPEAEVAEQADSMRATAAKEAANRLKLHFIMAKLAEELEVEVGEDEINGQIAAIARHQNRRFDRVRDELTSSNAIESLYLQMRDDKIIEHLLRDAKVTEEEAPAGA